MHSPRNTLRRERASISFDSLQLTIPIDIVNSNVVIKCMYIDYINKMFKKKRRLNADIMKLCISALGHAMK